MSKTPAQIALMAESGRLLASVFGYLDHLNLLGMSTLQVNDLVDNCGFRSTVTGRFG